MKLPLLKLTGLFLLAFAGFLSAQALPPGTGACQSCVVDTSWTITQNSTGVGPATGPSIVITGSNLAPGWATPLAGTKWISSALNQNIDPSAFTCCVGSTTYRVQFTVTNPATYGLNISLYSDNFATIELNGSPVPYTLEQEYAVLAASFPLAVTKGFVTGTNTLDFKVTNQGGAGGLDVAFTALSTGPSTPPFTLGANSGVSSFASVSLLPDPVDGGTGQFYETESDIELGGPMSLGFRRYYSSQLSNTNVLSALGTNWMTNYDAVTVITGTNAKVLMLGGTIVNFNLAGSVWQLTSPKDTPYQFIQNGKTFQFMDPASKWIYTFTTPGVLSPSIVGVLTSIADRNGNILTVTQGANGPTQVSDGLGRTLAFTYANGQLTQVTDQAARTFSFVYTGGLLTSSTDIYKQTTQYFYSTVGSLTALMQHKQLPLGNIPTSQTYDAQGRVLTQRIVPANDGNAYTSKIVYDANGGSTITDGIGNVTKHLNSSAGNIVQLSDPTGATAIVTYDGSDRRTSITDKLGNKTSYAYDSLSGLLASTTDALGNTTSFTYTSQAQGGFTFYYLAVISYPDGASTSQTYDPNGNVLSSSEKNGAVTKFAYDSNGRLITTTGLNQKTSTFVWNTDSTMASTADPLGNTQSFSYDNTKRVISETDANGGKTSYVLDKSTTGAMTAIIGPVTGESYTIYDDQNHQLQDVVNPLGGVYHSDYSATGQLNTYTDPLKNKTTYVYDGDQRLSTITNSAGEKNSYAYDVANRVTSVSDSTGPRLSYTYTPESRVATVTDGSGRKSSYGYDALGRISTFTSPAGNVYKTGYDKSGNATSRTNPLGEVTSLALDAIGTVKSVTMPGGITASVTRDANESITSLTSANGNTWTMTLDAGERLTKLTDPLGQSTGLTYTGTQITGATLPLGTVAITNDAAGRVLKQQFSDGTSFTSVYDANGALTSTDGVTIKRDVMGQAVNINGLAFVLDGEGRPVTLTYATGKAITYAYDANGRLSSISDWVGGKTTLNYDGAGNVTSYTYPNGVTTTNSYDADGNLVKIAAGSLSSIALTRDAAGKITSADRNLPLVPVLAASAQQFSYDSAGQLTGATYDLMGRATAEAGRTYTWNLASQLTGFKDGVNSATLTYDGLGEISSSTVTGATQNFVFNYLTDLPALSIVRQASADLRYYVYLPGGLLLYSVDAASNARHFYHFDEMGNTAFLTSDTGTVTDSYAISPYGEVAAHVGTTDNPFTWQGQFGVMQMGQDLYYMRDRYYDANTARFISRDPDVEFNPLASEPYAYAGGNPMLFIDPYGSDFFGIGAAFDWAKTQASRAATALKNAAIAAATAVKNAAIAAANKAKELAASIAAAAAKVVEAAREKLSAPVVAAVPKNKPVQASPAPQKPAAIAQHPVAATPAKLQPPQPIASGSPLKLPAGSPTATLNSCAALKAGCSNLGLPGVLGHTLRLAVNSNGQLISQDGGGVINHDGGSLIAQDGSSVINHDGGSVIVYDESSGVYKTYVVSNDGGSLISQDGSGFKTIDVPLISQDGSGFFGPNFNGLTNGLANGLVVNGGDNFRPNGN